MKYLLVSDNHGVSFQLEEMLRYFRPQVDFIFHLGDSEFPASDPIWKLVDAKVTGNVDYDPDYAEQLLIQTEDAKFFLAHGHYHVIFRMEHDQSRMIEAAHQADCRFFCHGHTHVPKAIEEEGVIIINPGSFAYPRGGYTIPSFAIITIEDGQVEVVFYNAQSYEPISEWTKTFDL